MPVRGKNLVSRIDLRKWYLLLGAVISERVVTTGVVDTMLLARPQNRVKTTDDCVLVHIRNPRYRLGPMLERAWSQRRITT